MRLPHTLLRISLVFALALIMSGCRTVVRTAPTGAGQFPEIPETFVKIPITEHLTRYPYLFVHTIKQLEADQYRTEDIRTWTTGSEWRLISKHTRSESKSSYNIYQGTEHHFSIRQKEIVTTEDNDYRTTQLVTHATSTNSLSNWTLRLGGQNLQNAKGTLQTERHTTEIIPVQNIETSVDLPVGYALTTDGKLVGIIKVSTPGAIYIEPDTPRTAELISAGIALYLRHLRKD